MRPCLVDTGPLVAFLNARDSAHDEVAERLGRYSGQLTTTSAVITEVMHFVAPSPTGPRLFADFVLATGLVVSDLTQPAALAEAAGLMQKYADLPMDFADATLVLLADRLELFDIFTLDRRGFRVFRGREGQTFRLMLDEE